MIIDKKIWKKIKENIDNLYWDEDRMSRDGIYFLKQLDNLVEKAEKENHLLDGLLYCGNCGHRISVGARRKVDNRCYI